MSVLEPKKVSALPLYSGALNKLHLLGVSQTSGDSVKFNLADFVTALTGGTLVPALASDLDISANAKTLHTQTPYIQTTGGDDSVKSGEARVTSFRGTEAGIVSSGVKIVAPGFNQIAPANISGQTATFPVVAAVWGTYGSAAQNNGYLFINASGTIVAPTSVTQGGSAVATHVENGVTYYLPADNGSMAATFASGIDVTAICGHICWSNYRDKEYAAYSESVIDLSAVIASAGGTLRCVVMGGRYVYDEIVQRQKMVPSRGSAEHERAGVERGDGEWRQRNVLSFQRRGDGHAKQRAVAAEGMQRKRLRAERKQSGAGDHELQHRERADERTCRREHQV